MASKTLQITGRDLEMLFALDRSPLTAVQLCTLSATFSQPFTHEKFVRRRLKILAERGWVRSFYYATTSRGGAPSYYRLTREGYRIAHGADAALPARTCFTELPVTRHFHTRSLADFIVHTSVAAADLGGQLQRFYPENTLRLDVAGEAVYPDCAFQLSLPGQPTFCYTVELDNSTERVYSPQDKDSWQRKIRLYEQYQNQASGRFRVLVLATRSQQRVTNILSAAASVLDNPHRSLFYGVHLPVYLTAAHPLHEPLFRDNRSMTQRLVPPYSASRPITPIRGRQMELAPFALAA